jgi:hypothetical protein
MSGSRAIFEVCVSLSTIVGFFLLSDVLDKDYIEGAA